MTFCFTAIAQRKPKDKILDRKVFVITMEDQSDKRGKADPFEEELSFRSNKMTSKKMRYSDKGGFQAGEYVISNKEEVLDEKVYHFQAINKNAKGMSLKWEGKVFGGQIEGTAIVSKKGKIKEEYTFTGALKEKRK
jgi:hypothetical protein